MYFLSIFLFCFILNQTVLFSLTTQEVFTDIYQKGKWGTNEKGEGTSGTGSKVETTVEYREYLQNFLIQKQIKTVLDIGCGDWEFSRLIDWGDIHYTGYDVVKSVIERNKAQFETEKIQFIQKNGIMSRVPEADLLICKDVLQHLSNRDISIFLKKLSKFKYCLITNDVDPDTLSSYNQDIETGGYRTLDLRAYPFLVEAQSVLTYQSKTEVKQVLLIVNHKN